MCISRKKNTYQDDVVVSKRATKKPVNSKTEDPPLPRPTTQKPDKVEKAEKQEAASPAPVPATAQLPTPNPEKEIQEQEKEIKEQPQKEEEHQKSVKLKSRSRRKEDDTLSNIPDDMPELEINRDKPEPFFSNEDLI